MPEPTVVLAGTEGRIGFKCKGEYHVDSGRNRSDHVSACHSFAGPHKRSRTPFVLAQIPHRLLALISN